MDAAGSESDVLARALDCLSQNDWPAAHALVQELESPLACWIHGLVHKIEGDIDNSRYWYRKAGATAKGYSVQTVEAQITELRRLLFAAAHR